MQPDNSAFTSPGRFRGWMLLFTRATALVLFLCVMGQSARGQMQTVSIINTVAGNGVAGFSGDSGQAIDASFNFPRAPNFDSAGNLYISDFNNHRVRKVAPSGIVTTFAGIGTPGSAGDGGPATSAELINPSGTAADSAGNIYICEYGGNRIRRVDGVTGIITTVAGTGAGGYSGDGGPATAAMLANPQDARFDSAGNLYFADYANNRIRKITMATGVITTVAGTGTSATAGNGGPATSASLYGPVGVVFDATGNLYISELNGNVVRRVSAATGIITAFAGNGTAGFAGDGGPATSAELNVPYGIAFDTAGNVFISDVDNQRIRMVNITTGIITTIAGNGTAGFSGDGGAATSAELNQPIELVSDSAGQLFVADAVNNRIREFTLSNLNFPTTNIGSSSATRTIQIETTAAETITSITVPQSDGGKQEYSVGTITGCTIGASNPVNTVCNIPITFSPAYPGPRWAPLEVVTSTGNINFGLTGIGTGPLAVLSPGVISTAAGTGTQGYAGDGSPATGAEVDGLESVTPDSAGNLYLADSANQRIRKVAAQTGVIATVAGNGTAGYSGDGGPATSAAINVPEDIALDSAQNLYIADEANNRIRMVTLATGIITTVAGNGTAGYSGDGGPATDATLNQPAGTVVDAAGNFYIADSANQRIRKVSAATGVITTVAGNGTAGYSGDGGPAISAELQDPEGMVFDSAGNLYFVDAGNQRIRELSTTGVITTVAGNGTAGYSGDGGPAIDAELNSPTRLAIDSANNLYIADSQNNRIRKVDAQTGLIATVAGNGTLGSTGDGGVAINAELSGPVGVGLDGAGNLFIAEYTGYRVRKIDQSQSILNYPTPTAVGTSDSADNPQTATLSNIGNASLSFPVPSSGNNPSISTNFTLNSSSGNCPLIDSSGSAGTLAAGASCTLPVSFTPTQGGLISGSLVLTDTNLNANPGTTQTISLAGTATGADVVTHFSVTGPNPAPFYTSTEITITALDASNNVVTSYTGPITFSSSDPGFSNINCSATLVSGSELCNIALKTAGTDTVTVSDATNPAITGTYATVVYPGSALGFFVTAPATATAGSQINFTVTAHDLYNNMATGYSGIAHFTSSDANATLPADATLTNGTGTFSATLKTQGNQTITATDTVTSSITGSSGPIAVTVPGFVVTTLADDVTGNPANCPVPSTGTNCTLRDAVAAGNALTGVNAGISFASGLGSITTPGTITLINGSLRPTQSMTITGPGSAVIIVDGNGSSGSNTTGNIFQIPANVTVAISGLTLQDAASLNGANQNGGAIDNEGTLSLSGMLIKGNNNGIGPLTGGAGIYNGAAATLTLTNSTVSGNSSSLFGGSAGQGGGILNEGGNMTITGSTIAGNQASSFGGNIATLGGTVVIKNSTIYGSNGTTSAGALYVGAGTVTVTDTTISGNSSASAPGVYVAGGTATFTNSIVAGNTLNNSGQPGNCIGCTLTSNDLVDTTVVLSPLGNYGGTTETLVPLPGSAAICTGISTGDTKDQRGYARPAGACYDIGSVQTQYTIAFTGQPTNTNVNATILTAAAGAVTVQIHEHGAGMAGAPIPLKLTGNGTLTGGGAVATDATGTASFSSLSVNAPGTGDTLTAVASTASAAPLSAISNSFNVLGLAAQLAFMPAPATTIAAGTGQTITIQEETAAGSAVTATDAITLTVTGPNGYSKSYGPIAAVGGVATFSNIQAPTKASSYSYTATSGALTPAVANQSVTSATASTVTATAGNHQSAVINTAFTVPLKVTVADVYGNPVAGVTVKFSAPASGASATLTKPATTAADGTTSVTAAANGTANAASYSVTASVAGAVTAVFTLTNTPATPTLTFATIPTHTYGDAPFIVSATSASNGAVTYTVVSGPATISGSTVTVTGAGMVMLSALQTATTDYTAATANTGFTIVKEATIDGVSASNTTITPSESVTLTATVRPATRGTPTGTVMYYDNGNPLGSARTLANDTAQYSTAALAPGMTHVISVSYSGDADFLANAAATSVTTTITVAALDFTITSTGAQSQSVIPGSTATFSFAVRPTYGVYPGTVTFAVAGLPKGATISFSPNTVAVNAGPAPISVIVKTAPQNQAKNQREEAAPFALGLLLLPFAFFRRIRQCGSRTRLLLLVLVGGFAATAGLIGCGGGNGFFGQPPQNYTITITATSGSIQHSVSVTLNVQ